LPARALMLSELSAAQQPDATVAVEPSASLPRVLAGGGPRQADLAAQPSVKIGIRRAGWYRLTQPELLAAGLNPNVDPRRLQLFVDGQPVAITVTGEADGWPL
jgi:hypothetical protein